MQSCDGNIAKRNVLSGIDYFTKISSLIYLMSITRGVRSQSLEPEAHDKVLHNNTDRIGIWNVG